MCWVDNIGMIGFTTKQLETPSVGEKLKALREKMDIDLESLAKKTKIRAVYLQRLEVNDYEKLPAEIYIEGFIKKYSQALDIDSRPFVEEYKNEQKKIKKIIQQDLPSLKTPKFILTPKTISQSLIFSAILVISGYFFYQINFLLKPPKLILLSPKTDMIIKDDKIQFIGQVGPDVYLTINNQEVYIDKEGNFKEELILKNGLNFIELIAKNRFDKSASIIRKIIKK